MPPQTPSTDSTQHLDPQAELRSSLEARAAWSGLAAFILAAPILFILGVILTLIIQGLGGATFGGYGAAAHGGNALSQLASGVIWVVLLYADLRLARLNRDLRLKRLLKKHLLTND